MALGLLPSDPSFAGEFDQPVIGADPQLELHSIRVDVCDARRPSDFARLLLPRMEVSRSCAWVSVMGALWWYLLSKIAEVLFHLVAGRDGSPSVYTSGRLGTGSRVASWKWPAAKRL